MTVLAAGQGLRRVANTGMKAVSELEREENRLREQLEAADEGQKMQMYSTGAGIGASYGVQNALAQNAAFTPAPVVDGIATHAAGSEAVLAGEAVVGDVVASSANAAAVEGATSVAVEGATAAAAEGTAAVVAEGATAVAAEGAAAGTAAAGTGGTLGTLGAIAAPVAIGLGVAFLLNKLFD